MEEKDGQVVSADVDRDSNENSMEFKRKKARMEASKYAKLAADYIRQHSDESVDLFCLIFLTRSPEVREKVSKTFEWISNSVVKDDKVKISYDQDPLNKFSQKVSMFGRVKSNIIAYFAASVFIYTDSNFRGWIYISGDKYERLPLVDFMPPSYDQVGLLIHEYAHASSLSIVDFAYAPRHLKLRLSRRTVHNADSYNEFERVLRNVRHIKNTQTNGDRVPWDCILDIAWSTKTLPNCRDNGIHIETPRE